MNKYVNQLIESLNLQETEPGVFTIGRKPLNTMRSGATSKDAADVHTYFPETVLIAPDAVCRPEGDTTFFTTSGVQHLETLLNKDKDLSRYEFSVYQPCIRTQFTPHVKEGTSTSFVNFSSVVIDAGMSDFINQSVNFMKLLNSYGMTQDSMRIQFVERENTWGDRTFNSTVLIVANNGLEIGESIFMHEFPVSEGKKVDVVEIGMGIDRLVWNTGLAKHYFNGFIPVYDKHKEHSADAIASVIDCIRTATLIAGSGVEPSNKNHGYRLRNLLKTFTERNYDARLNTKELMHLAYNDWSAKGNRFDLSEEGTAKIMQKEIDRNYNNLLLKKLEQKFGVKSKIDINLPVDQFQKSLTSKLSTEGLVGFNDFFRE